MLNINKYPWLIYRNTESWQKLSRDIPQPPKLTAHSAEASNPSYCPSLPNRSQLAFRHPVPSLLPGHRSPSSVCFGAGTRW